MRSAVLFVPAVVVGLMAACSSTGPADPAPTATMTVTAHPTPAPTVTVTIAPETTEPADEISVVAIHGSGDESSLEEACDTDVFVRIPSYTSEDVPPVAAALNSCAGGPILEWQDGQRVRVTTDDGDESGVYEVVDIRYTPRIWAATGDLAGLQGVLALQSQHYGEDRMKFVGLMRVE